MKAHKRKENLAAAQAWWDKLPEKDKQGTTRPGSVNQRTATAL